MPKGFSEEEKTLIREKMKSAARELFIHFGLKKTNVEEITRACGISKGAFYLFYPSKEALFLEILEQEDQEIKAALRSRLLPPFKPSREDIRIAMLDMLNRIQSHPLLTVFRSEEYEALVRKLEPHSTAQHVDGDAAYFRALYQEGVAMGYFRRMDEEPVTDFTTALFLLSLHRGQLAVFDFEKMAGLLADMFAAYILVS